MRNFIRLCFLCSFCSSLVVAYDFRQFQKSKEPKEITAKSKTGFMIGIESGVSLFQNSSTGSSYGIFTVDVGVRVGYNVYFVKEHGIRIYGNYNYTLATINGDSSVVNLTALGFEQTQRFGFGLDYLWDFFNNNDLGLSLGLFLGVGGGYDLRPLYSYGNTDTYRSGFYGNANIGFDIIFHSHNRIDLTYKYHFLTPAFESTSGTSSNISSPFSFHIGYSYIF